MLALKAKKNANNSNGAVIPMDKSKIFRTCIVNNLSSNHIKGIVARTK